MCRFFGDVCILTCRQFGNFTQKRRTAIVPSVKVAGVGLEPHDLRVMSPTSYQLLHPAMYL